MLCWEKSSTFCAQSIDIDPHEVKKSVTKLCDKELEPVMNKSDSLDITSKNYIEHIFENICKRIYLKTIIIEGDKKYVKGISDGLNTQIPISEVDILAGSEYVYKINKILASENIRIIKEGEVENRNQISVINFAKKYKIISGIPGTSKNLNKNTVEELLQEAAGDKSISDLAKKLRIVVEADEWWTRNRKNELVKVEEDEENICKYGRNYYESYVVLHMPENTDDDVLSNIFIDFIKKAKLAKSDKVMAEFKKDELFYEIKNLYLAEKGKKIEESEKNEMIRSNLQKLTKYLNKNKESKSLSALITRFFENIGIDFENFRTIRTREEYQPLEAFPFSSSTFIDIYKNIDFTKKMEIKAFGDSKFCHEIEKNFPVFVIIIDKDGNINDVKYIENFSFIGNKSKAEKVYNDTVNAFKAGNEEDFVKESDDRGFHIRPKARTADDTFEFSNGKEITKRTFWANRNLIKDLLGEYLSKSGADS